MLGPWAGMRPLSKLCRIFDTTHRPMSVSDGRPFRGARKSGAYSPDGRSGEPVTHAEGANPAGDLPEAHAEQAASLLSLTCRSGQPAQPTEPADRAGQVREHPATTGAPADVALNFGSCTLVELVVQEVGHVRAGLAAVVAMSLDRIQGRCHASFTCSFDTQCRQMDSRTLCVCSQRRWRMSVNP